MIEASAAQWDEFVQKHPDAHLLQSRAWGDLKTAFGWRAHWVIQGNCGAQVLFRSLPLGLTLAYLPKGPVGAEQPAEWPALWLALDTLCRRQHAVYLKVEPDQWQGDASAAEQPLLPGFLPSPQTIQPPRTLVVSLEGGEDEILGRMKQKTRYNIRLAQKKGVVVRTSNDLACFQQLMLATGERDRFGVHSQAYYQKCFDLFNSRGECALLLAEAENQPLAGLMVFKRGKRAWYFYGASNDLERNRMPTYLLQWEAMRWARQQGCCEYDLWGVPDADEETLEAGFEQRQDGLWGVYRFKRGFGGALLRSVGAWDRVYQPVLYRLYRLWLKSIAE